MKKRTDSRRVKTVRRKTSQLTWLKSNWLDINYFNGSTLRSFDLSITLGRLIIIASVWGGTHGRVNAPAAITIVVREDASSQCHHHHHRARPIIHQDAFFGYADEWTANTTNNGAAGGVGGFGFIYFFVISHHLKIYCTSSSTLSATVVVTLNFKAFVASLSYRLFFFLGRYDYFID